MRSYPIGEAANAAGLNARTIRYYEQIGLIPGAPRMAGNGAAAAGTRVYSEDDVGRLRFVKRAREVELSLKDVRSLVSVADGSGCPSTHSAYREILRAQLRRCEDQPPARAARQREPRVQDPPLQRAPRSP